MVRWYWVVIAFLAGAAAAIIATILLIGPINL
jgi:hypothetical protein